MMFLFILLHHESVKASCKSMEFYLLVYLIPIKTYIFSLQLTCRLLSNQLKFLIMFRWHGEVKPAFLTNHAVVYGSPVQAYVPPRFDRMNADNSCISEFSSNARYFRRTFIASSLNTLLPDELSCTYSLPNHVNKSFLWRLKV